jgi:hypothetical protein
MICPHCEHELTPEEIKTIWARYTSSLASPHAGPGRPRRKKRCRCGAMTLKMAKQRYHNCPPKVKKEAA